ARKLALITHTPTLYSHEMASNLAPEIVEDILYAEPCVRRAAAEELEVMRSVHTIFWPCPEAAASYHGWSPPGTIAKPREVWVETGVAPAPATISRQEMRSTWQIESGQKVVLFLGRPHPHKGFNEFVDMADRAHMIGRHNWIFVLAGAAPDYKRDLS